MTTLIRSISLVFLFILSTQIYSQTTSKRVYGTTSSGGESGFGNIFSMGADGSNFKELVSFEPGGVNPVGGDLLRVGSRLYGLTRTGGASNNGILYSIDDTGSDFEIVHIFNGSGGSAPIGGLVYKNNKLFGVARGGGLYDNGVLFKMNLDGTGYEIIHEFINAVAVTHKSYGPGIIIGNDDKIYGSTEYGSNGQIYRVNTDGTDFEVLHTFSGDQGIWPTGKLIQDTDGTLYGYTRGGGIYENGTVFKIQPNGSSFIKLHDFTDLEGNQVSALALSPDGYLYGALLQSPSDGGSLFKLNKLNGQSQIIFRFSDTQAHGLWPSGTIKFLADDSLVGHTYQGGLTGHGVLFKVQNDGSSFQKLFEFSGSNESNSRSPMGILLESNLIYGITEGSWGNTNDHGTIFKYNISTGQMDLLYAFNAFFGEHPKDNMVLSTDGYLYGVAEGGGNGFGTIYRMNYDGSEFEVVHNFNEDTGAFPFSGLIVDQASGIYGTTQIGGVNNEGVIFRLDLNGTNYQKIFDFEYGRQPNGNLLLGTDNKLYGTTLFGGAFNHGTVFSVNKNGSGFTTIHSFSFASGGLPRSNILEVEPGVLHGVTTRGGAEDNGVVFKINTDGSGYSVLKDFSYSEGVNIIGGLILGSDNYVYGMMSAGGAFGAGTIFKIWKDGSNFQKIHDFEDHQNGRWPSGELLEVAPGQFYGQVSVGGDFMQGGVFSINGDGSGFRILQGYSAGRPFENGLICVEVPNQAPSSVGIDDITVDQGVNTTTVALASSFMDDLDNSSELVYEIINNSNPGLFNNLTINNGELNITYNTNLVGSSSLTIRASDLDGLSTQESFQVTVNCNQPIEPTLISSSLSYSNVGDRQMTLNWNNGNGSKRVVIARENSEVSVQPTDGLKYVASSTFGNGQNLGNGNYVVYNGSGSSFTAIGLDPETTYHFAVIEYNTDINCILEINYLTSTILSGSANTLCNMPPEPTVPSSGMTVPSLGITTNSARFGWVNGNGARRLVLARAHSPVSAVPVDGVSYVASSNLFDAPDIGGGNRVVYISTTNELSVFILEGLNANTTYYIKVFDYNIDTGCYLETNYLTSPSLSGSVTTKCTNPEPTSASGPISFSNVTSSSMRLSWSKGNGNRRIVIARKGSSVSRNPVDGSSYSASSSFGNGSHLGSGNYVVYDGTGSTVTVYGLSSSSSYHYAIHEYNYNSSCDPIRNYDATKRVGTRSTNSSGGGGVPICAFPPCPIDEECGIDFFDPCLARISSNQNNIFVDFQSEKFARGIIQVYDLNGKVIKNINNSIYPLLHHEIPVTNAKGQIYIVRVINNFKTETKKVFLMK